ncbi:MAG: type II toxin-antitoxin system VapC family toxin [Candidatus Bathyarchaeia archaeon]
MKFVDSNIFLHAYLVPRRPLTKDEHRVKDEAKAIVKRIEEGEEVAITVVHLSEVVNVVEAGLGIKESLGFLAWVVTSENVKVYSVGAKDYEAALLLAKEKEIGANDALAYLFMKAHGISEIYTFDKHFKKLGDITKLPEM